jgi:hypothetical protein
MRRRLRRTRLAWMGTRIASDESHCGRSGKNIALKGIETCLKYVPARDDLTFAAFLSVLSGDIEPHPQVLRAFPASLAKHIASLTEGDEFDPDAK